MEFRLKYREINNSFDKKLIFHLGCDGGFFSEYNNMILAMLYCLEHNIQFTLYSKDANFGIKNGWPDYFLPFCEENTNSFNRFFNYRPIRKYKIEAVQKLYGLSVGFFRKTLDKNTFITSDLWNEIRNLPVEKTYSIARLNLRGNLRDICRELISMTWRYNTETQVFVGEIKQTLNLPEKYAGFHIRGGDKFIETQIQSIDIYMKKSHELSGIKDIFVLTDDYTVIENLRENYHGYSFFTLCEEQERGYYHQQFKKQSKEQKRKQLLNLFVSMDLLAESEFFIGTFSSNPGMYLGMRMKPEKTYSVDIPEWRIW